MCASLATPWMHCAAELESGSGLARCQIVDQRPGVGAVVRETVRPRPPAWPLDQWFGAASSGMHRGPRPHHLEMVQA
eukprot:11186692-Lingulodinium_polyedra.AAC.1